MKSMIINLDYQSRLPIYEQIINTIENYVSLGILKANEQIPSIREMASSIGVNPNTVKKAYDVLESKKVIKTISTKGTFITDNIENITKEKINKEINIIKEKVVELNKMGVSTEEIIESIKK